MLYVGGELSKVERESERGRWRLLLGGIEHRAVGHRPIKYPPPTPPTNPPLCDRQPERKERGLGGDLGGI